MILPELGQTIEIALRAWLGVTGAVVLWKILIVDGQLNGLLTTVAGRAAEPERAQLLVVALGGLATYLTACVQAVAHPETAHALPNPPSELIAVLAASQAIYMGGKIARTRPGKED